MTASARTILLKVPGPETVELDDQRLCARMFAYWLGINAGRQRDWPMPPEFADRVTKATIGLESKTNDVDKLPIARALSLTAQMKSPDDARAPARLWREIISKGAFVEQLKKPGS